jgi:hypothetical protein
VAYADTIHAKLVINKQPMIEEINKKLKEIKIISIRI